MNKTWLIKVKATEYNILGAVREYEDRITWHFENDAPVCEDDKVYFYLTNSSKSDKSSPLDGMFKRFLFEGKVINTYNGYRDEDTNFWTNEKHHETVISQNYITASILITRNLYDFKIYSNTVKNSGIWDAKFSRKDVYLLDSQMVQSIAGEVNKHTQ